MKLARMRSANRESGICAIKGIVLSDSILLSDASGSSSNDATDGSTNACGDRLLSGVLASVTLLAPIARGCRQAHESSAVTHVEMDIPGSTTRRFAMPRETVSSGSPLQACLAPCVGRRLQPRDLPLRQ